MEDDRRKETRTVTLEITQREAEKVMVASRLERLSLSLSLSLSVRSASSWAPATAEVSLPVVSWGGDVSNALRGRNAQTETQPPATIRVVQGQRQEEFRF